MSTVELNLRKEEIEWFRMKAAYLGIPMIDYILFLLRGAVWRAKERDEQERGEQLGRGI